MRRKGKEKMLDVRTRKALSIRFQSLLMSSLRSVPWTHTYLEVVLILNCQQWLLPHLCKQSHAEELVCWFTARLLAHWFFVNSSFKLLFSASCCAGQEGREVTVKPQSVLKCPQPHWTFYSLEDLWLRHHDICSIFKKIELF